MDCTGGVQQNFFNILIDDVLGQMFFVSDIQTHENFRLTCCRMARLGQRYPNVAIAAAHVFKEPMTYARGLGGPYLQQDKTIAICALTHMPELIESESVPRMLRDDIEVIKTAYVAAVFLKKRELTNRLTEFCSDLDCLGHQVVLEAKEMEDAQTEPFSYMPFLLHSKTITPEHFAYVPDYLRKVLPLALSLVKKDARFLSCFDDSFRHNKEFILAVLKEGSNVFSMMGKELQKDPEVLDAYFDLLEKRADSDRSTPINMACAYMKDSPVTPRKKRR